MSTEQIQSILEQIYGNCTIYENEVCRMEVNGTQAYVNPHDLNPNSVELSGYIPGSGGIRADYIGLGNIGMNEFFIGQNVDLSKYYMSVFNSETGSFEAITIEEYENIEIRIHSRYIL